MVVKLFEVELTKSYGVYSAEKEEIKVLLGDDNFTGKKLCKLFDCCCD